MCKQIKSFFSSIEDLWKELEIASKKPVRDVMTTWTEKMGFPVVNISCEKVRENVLPFQKTFFF